MKPSRRFTEWLDTQLRVRLPGARLATTAQLAQRWALAPITVSRILDKYHKSGAIVRIPRRGTFVAPLEQAAQPGPAPPASSAQIIIDTVKQSINSGALRTGDALASVKFMSRQFRVAPRTVIAAYRQLEAQTHVTRVGKTCWVGSFTSLVKRRAGSEVFFLKESPPDYSPLFSSPELGLAFRTMEKELVDHGLIVQYDSYDAVPRLLERWRRENRWPSGVVLAWLAQGHEAQLQPFMQALGRVRSPRRVPLLTVIDTADYRTLPRAAIMVSRGNLHTMLARAIAHHLLATGMRQAYFFLQYDGANLLDSYVPLKTRVELHSFDPAFTTRITVTSSVAGLTREDFLRELHLHSVPDYRRQAIFGKYHDGMMQTMEDEIDLSVGDTPSFHRIGKGLWVFNSDRQALQALTWAAHERIAIPGDIEILSLENNPAFYQYGISACVPDWSNAGYLMAHALLGNISWPRTGKGFMRIGAMIIHRRSSRAR